MIVLKIIGWILLGILALIIAVLCVRVTVITEYSDKTTSLALKWLFINIPIYPKKKSENKPEEPKPETTEALPEVLPEGTVTEDAPPEEVTPEETPAEDAASEEVTEEKKEPEKKKSNPLDLLKTLYEAEGVDGLIEIVKRVFSYLGTFFGGLLRAFIVDDLQLDVRCAKKDSAKTAIYYGEVCSTLFPMLGSLASGTTLKKYDINVYPDFLARYSEASFYIKFHVVPIRLIGITLALVFKLIFKVLIGLIIKISGAKKTGAPTEQNTKQSENTNNIRKSEIANE